MSSYQRARKHAEAAERWAADITDLLQGMSDGVAVLDASGRFILLNQEAKAILGEHEELDKLREYKARGFRFLHLDGTPLGRDEAPYTRVWRGEQVSGIQFMVERPDGSRRTVLCSANAIHDESGRLSKVLFIYRDITDLRESEKIRQEYLSVISHDLRSPLQAILGHAAYLKRSLERTGLRGREIGSLIHIVNSAERLNAMIQDLLDSSAMELGQAVLVFRPVELPKLVKDLLSRNRKIEGWRRVVAKMPGSGLTVRGDPARLERVLNNLLTNAINYSPADSEIILKAEAQAPHVLVSVNNSGTGISPGDLPYIFERFHRFAGPHKAGGVGLGLYISKMFVEAHGGKLWVESQPGNTTFYFTLPTA